jgi:CheY-like chemotaxis protein
LYLPQVESAAASGIDRHWQTRAKRHRCTPNAGCWWSRTIWTSASFANQILQDLGYETAWATNAEQALQLAGTDAMAFDAVFSDVVMPGISGIALARELRRRRADLPVILTSGYSEELARSGYDGFEFLAKPYSAEQVSRILARTWG